MVQRLAEVVPGLYVRSSHVLSMSVWASPGYSNFLPQTVHIHAVGLSRERETEIETEIGLNAGKTK